MSENETLEDDDPVAAAQAKELELLNQFAEGNGISPIGREKNGCMNIFFDVKQNIIFSTCIF